VVLQINKEADALQNPRFGKMAWGLGSVYLRLKKRHPDDKGAHILQAGVVEKDLGLEAIVEADQDLALDDSENEEDGELTVIANPSSGDKPATHDTEGASDCGGDPDCPEARARRHSLSSRVMDCLEQYRGRTKVLKQQYILLRTVSRNRSAVLVRKRIHANLMPHYSSDDLTTVMLESNEQRLLVACYMAHDRPAPPDHLSSLVEFGSKDDQLLIGANANAQHSVWGGSDTNDRGESLLDFVLSLTYIANVGENTSSKVLPRQSC